MGTFRSHHRPRCRSRCLLCVLPTFGGIATICRHHWHFHHLRLLSHRLWSQQGLSFHYHSGPGDYLFDLSARHCPCGHMDEGNDLAHLCCPSVARQASAPMAWFFGYKIISFASVEALGMSGGVRRTTRRSSCMNCGSRGLNGDPLALHMCEAYVSQPRSQNRPRYSVRSTFVFTFVYDK